MIGRRFDQRPFATGQRTASVINGRMIEAEIPHLRRYARALVREREAADDLVQDTLERAWRKRHLWQPSGRLRSWLFRILYRLYLDCRPRRQQAHHKLIALEDMVTDVPSKNAPQQVSLHCRDVLQAIDRLSEKHRAVLLLVALEQPSYHEGARMLGLRVGTFRSRLSRARDSLNEQLAAEQTPVSDREAQ
jgi:RNA polymerase sigma-70 factor (ECF subfamily)